MKIKIESNVEFEVNGKPITVDARELFEMKQTMWRTKATANPTNPDKTELDWAIIIAEIQAFIKEKCKVDLVASEAIAIYHHIDRAWREIEKNWLPPTEASPTSPPNSDLASLD